MGMTNRAGNYLQIPPTSKRPVGNDVLTAFVVTMISHLITWVYSFIPSRLLNWWKWCPTSLEELDKAELNILSYLKKPYIGEYVNVELPCCPDNCENKIWTIKVNPDIDSDQVPLVLIHGFASGVGLWVMNLDALSFNRPVYAFDLLGFGKSSRPTFSKDAVDAEYQLVYSIEAWRKKVGLKKFVLLGHSMGGFIAASYSLLYPENVSHLILCDPWGFPDRPISTSNRYQLPSWVKFIAAFFTPFNPLASLRAIGPAGPVILKKIRSDLRRKFSPLITDGQAIANYLYHCNAQNPSGEAAFKAMTGNCGWAKNPMINRIDDLRKDIPITFIYGSRSWVDRHPGIQIKYTRLKSYVDVQVIQGSGHHVYADKPGYFNKLVQKICKKVDTEEMSCHKLNGDTDEVNLNQ